MKYSKFTMVMAGLGATMALFGYSPRMPAEGSAGYDGWRSMWNRKLHW